MIAGTGEDQRDQRVGRQPHHHGEAEDGQGDEPEHRGECLTRLLGLASFQVPAQDRDQCDRQVGAGEQVVEEVGDGERLPVEIAFGSDPEQRGEQRLSSQTEET